MKHDQLSKTAAIVEAVTKAAEQFSSTPDKAKTGVTVNPATGEYAVYANLQPDCENGMQKVVFKV